MDNLRIGKRPTCQVCQSVNTVVVTGVFIPTDPVIDSSNNVIIFGHGMCIGCGSKYATMSTDDFILMQAWYLNGDPFGDVILRMIRMFDLLNDSRHEVTKDEVWAFIVNMIPLYSRHAMDSHLRLFAELDSDPTPQARPG